MKSCDSWWQLLKADFDIWRIIGYHVLTFVLSVMLKLGLVNEMTADLEYFWLIIGTQVSTDNFGFIR